MHKSNGLGIPSEGDFGHESLADDHSPLGAYTTQGWRVPLQVNEEVQHTVGGGRLVRAFKDRPASYDAMFKASVARNPGGEAIVCGARRLTYRELDEQVQRVACGLVLAGLETGDRVAIMLGNQLEFVVAVLACVRAGAIAVPLGTRLGPADVAYIVSHAQPRFVVTADAWSSRFSTSDSVAKTFLVDSDGSEEDAFSSLSVDVSAPLPTLSEQDMMMIIYTSGTTGKPKGACLTHLNFLHTCLHYLYALAIDRPQRSLLVVPATHIAGFGPVLSVTLASGGTVVLMQEFKARKVLEAMANERITYTVLVPTMYQLCALEPGFQDHDLSAWRYGIYGAAIMPPAVIERFAGQLPQLRMINAYGATETCAVCTIMPPELTREAPASVGLPLQCDDLLIVDEHGVEVPNGQTGEIWVRGPNVIPRYWRDDEATAKSFRNGYWLSGDIGSRDERGLIYVHDRLKDMINRGGFKVFSAEVENALMEHSDVIDCALVGVPDMMLGEKIFALVKIQASGADAQQLAAYLGERIADYKVPDYWHIGIDDLPRNQNGKLQKGLIRTFAVSQLGNAS